MSEPERTAPESFLLLKFGANVYTRDGKEDSFRFDDAPDFARTKASRQNFIHRKYCIIHNGKG